MHTKLMVVQSFAIYDHIYEYSEVIKERICSYFSRKNIFQGGGGHCPPCPPLERGKLFSDFQGELISPLLKDKL